MKNILFFAFLLFSLASSATEGRKMYEKEEKGQLTLKKNKGKLFFYWGYNRASYARSDIKLKGPNYNFELSDVKAKDLPKKFSSIYFNPLKFTIPQFNFRVGFFVSDKYAISAGWDHMKYQTVNRSKAKINGYISEDASILYQGSYDNNEVLIDHDHLVKMEHSDGFNIINFNIERHELLFASNNERYGFSLVSGAGLGIALPWTNSYIFGAVNDDRPHFSGLGAQVFVAPEFIFLKRIFARFTVQAGFANMWDIAITPKRDKSDTHAEQTIYYLERSIEIGYRFRFFKR